MAKEKSKLKKVDAPAYTYLQALYMSFYSKYLYIDVAKRWKGIGFFYILLLTAICSIPVSLKASYDYNKLFNQQILEPILLLPTVYVQGGNVIFDKPMPFFIKNKEGKVVIIIDNTGTIKEKTPDYPELGILITKNSINFMVPSPDLAGVKVANPANELPVTQEFTKQVNVVFDGKSILRDNKVESLKFVTQLMLYPLITSILLGTIFTMFLVLAFLGQVFTQVFFSFSLPFKKSSRILMVASTPGLILFSLCLTLNLLFLGSGFIFLAFMTGYYSFAIHHLKVDSKKLVK